MRGKYTNKKQVKRRRWILAAVILCLAVVCILVGVLLYHSQFGPAETSPHTAAQTGAQTTAGTESGTELQTQPLTEAQTRPVQLEEVEGISIPLTDGLRITDVGKYTGVYMEDGSDEIVSGVMMIAVTNEGDAAVQYAEITLPVGEQTASFSLSTLPVGKTVILLEKTRMAYVPGEYTTAQASSVALFSQPLSLCEDKLQIQILDGAINVSNISGSDIAGDIVIYYKNSAADVYYGGITYRVRLEGGLEAGQVRQIMASHFSAAGSAIMFVTCGEG